MVLQVYVSAPLVAGHPLRMLRAFDAATVKAGETRGSAFSIPLSELTAYDAKTKQPVLHAGDYTVSVGFSSRDIRATATVTLGGSGGAE